MNDLPGSFLMEVAFRSAVMFIVLLVALRFTGKRGVKQLSVFETVIIIALGSAAGDPMFYEDVGLIPALMVFFVVIALYRFVTWLTGKSKWFEVLVEGRTVRLIHDGRFSISHFSKESLAQDEFFTELRIKAVEHLGQVKEAYLEPTGDLSIFYFAPEEVKHGLPILPETFKQKTKILPEPGIYSCTFCGFTLELAPGSSQCPVCKRDEWVKALKTIRRP